MRRGLPLFLLLLLALIIFLVHWVWILLTLLFVDGHADAILRSEIDLPNAGGSSGPAREQLIPKLIHQTYKTADVPPVWQEAQQSCLDLHKEADGWQYIMWTDDRMDYFIKNEYPWFLDTFRAYEFPIQRADAIRYFVLAHYGGVYIDLDDGCNRPLDPLLGYPAFVRKTIPTGISNDVMGATPQHPFFLRVTKELENYNRGWILPYITVMASTGPLFLSIIWRHYSSEGLNIGDGRDGGRVRILFPQEYMAYPWSFFVHHLGSSWHSTDSDLIFWMSRNWIMLTVVGFTVAGGVIFAVWILYRRFTLATKAGSDLPRWKRKSIQSRFYFWRSADLRREYELANRTYRDSP